MFGRSELGNPWHWGISAGRAAGAQRGLTVPLGTRCPRGNHLPHLLLANHG